MCCVSFFAETARRFLPCSKPRLSITPRDSFQSAVWNILHNNYEEFKANYDESYQRVRLLPAGRRDKSVP